MGKRWYCVNAHPHDEFTAKQHLRDQQFKVFLPTEIVQQKSGPKRKPLFPGYLFVAFNLDDASWRSIPYTRGVKRLISATAETPTPLPRGCVSELYRRLVAAGHIMTRSENLMPGDRIEVLDGTFAYWTGILEASTRDRVTVLLDLFGRSTRTTMPRSAIRLTQ